MQTKRTHRMFVIALVILAAGFGPAGAALAQTPPKSAAHTLKSAAMSGEVASALQTTTPVRGAPDKETLIQGEIARLEHERDRISAALAGVGAHFSALTFSPN